MGGDSFQLRLFDLDSAGCLSYYKSAAEQAKGPNSKKQINIAGAKVKPLGYDGKFYSFEVVATNGDRIVLGQENPEDSTAWTTTLQNASAYHGDKQDLAEGEALPVVSARSIPTVKEFNQAFVFVKPHANTDATRALVAQQFADRGMTILSEGEITAEEIDQKQLIDQHYFAIASKATILKPSELNVPSDKFEDKFGLTWEAALASGDVYNAKDGCEFLGISADEMDAEWAKCKKAKKLVKFGGGFYCGLIEAEGKPPIYVFNGFFMSMRSKYTVPGESIHYYSVEWKSEGLSWADFRGQVNLKSPETHSWVSSKTTHFPSRFSFPRDCCALRTTRNLSRTNSFLYPFVCVRFLVLLILTRPRPTRCAARLLPTGRGLASPQLRTWVITGCMLRHHLSRRSLSA